MSQFEMTQYRIIRFLKLSVFSIFFSTLPLSVCRAELSEKGISIQKFETGEEIEMAPERLNSNENHRFPASIDRAVMAFAAPSKVFYGKDSDMISPEMIATYNKIKSSETHIDAQKFIPLDFQPGCTSATVMSRVADKSLQTFFSSQTFKQTPLGVASHQVEEAVKTDVVINQTESTGVQHKFQISLQAFQNYAQIQYTGFGKAAFKYYLDQSKNRLSFEYTENITNKQKFIFSHTQKRLDDMSQVAWALDF